jgi:hypothetical protein
MMTSMLVRASFCAPGKEQFFIYWYFLFPIRLGSIISCSEGDFHRMGFFGTLSGGRCIEKYQRELASILCHEIMVRISNGTALNIGGGIISPFSLMEAVVAYLEVGYN